MAALLISLQVECLVSMLEYTGSSTHLLVLGSSKFVLVQSQTD
jgi:hypothetical protein